MLRRPYRWKSRPGVSRRRLTAACGPSPSSTACSLNLRSPAMFTPCLSVFSVFQLVRRRGFSLSRSLRASGAMKPGESQERSSPGRALRPSRASHAEMNTRSAGARSDGSSARVRLYTPNTPSIRLTHCWTSASARIRTNRGASICVTWATAFSCTSAVLTSRVSSITRCSRDTSSNM